MDQDGEVVEVYLHTKRDDAAKKHFFKRLLRSHGDEPRKIATDKLRAHAAIYNLFYLGRHLIKAGYCRKLREGAFAERSRAVD